MFSVVQVVYPWPGKSTLKWMKAASTVMTVIMNQHQLLAQWMTANLPLFLPLVRSIILMAHSRFLVAYIPRAQQISRNLKISCPSSRQWGNRLVLMPSSCFPKSPYSCHSSSHAILPYFPVKCSSAMISLPWCLLPCRATSSNCISSSTARL